MFTPHNVSHVTRDMWQVTFDMREEVKLLSKFQLASSYGLVVRGDTWHLTPDTWHLTSILDVIFVSTSDYPFFIFWRATISWLAPCSRKEIHVRQDVDGWFFFDISHDVLIRHDGPPLNLTGCVFGFADVFSETPWRIKFNSKKILLDQIWKNFIYFWLHAKFYQFELVRPICTIQVNCDRVVAVAWKY